jgi:predicted MPP superfamily phosphohydrolase
MPHPQLWPAIIGAALGLALIAWTSIWLAQNWSGMSARKRWAIFIALGLFEAAYWVNIYAWFVEPRRLVVREIEIVSEDWRGAPMTIAAISDTHVGGPHVNSARMLRIVRRVNNLRPDLVVLLGDYVNGHAPEAERTPEENQEIIGGIGTFAALTARYGVVAVIGNHDVWYGRQTITTALQEAGAAVLWDRNIVIRRSSGALAIVGLQDDVTGRSDFDAALDGAPAEVDTIAISHSPDPFARVPQGISLMLAAHGHCGQVTIPLIGRPILPLRHKRYACGLIQESGSQMYVTGGIGTSILPVRFLNPPEIVVVRIRTGRSERSPIPIE